MPTEFAMDGALAVLTFRNPPMNLLTQDAMDGFAAGVQAALDQGARALLTLAEGEHFCAGADVVANFRGRDSGFGRRRLARSFAMLQFVERLPIPTVVAVRGLTLGGGCELMQLHDIVFAGESAGIGQVEAQIGTTTLLGGAQRLVARIGLARAKEMLFSAQPYPAAKLLEWGMINRVLPDAEVEAAARGYARKLADGPTQAYRISKALANAAAQSGIAAADTLTVETAPAIYDSADKRAAVEAFAAKGARGFREGLRFEGR